MILGQKYKGGISYTDGLELPFWVYEQMISIANDQAEEEKKQRDKDEETSKANTNINPSSYLNQMSGMMNKFK